MDAFLNAAHQGQRVESIRNWLIVSVALTLAAWIGREISLNIIGMFELADHPTPYFIPSKAILLNLLGPLSAVAISLFFMWPGLILATAFGQSKDLVRWVLMGFALSMLVLCVPAMVIHQATDVILRGSGYVAFVAVVTALCLGLLYWRVLAGKASMPDWALNRGDIIAATVAGFVVLVSMSAKFYWENFSPDGAGVLNFVRLYINTDWPFWPRDAGAIQVAPGVTSYLFVLPASWFQRLLGENELAMRMPHVLYIGMIYIVAMGLIRAGRDWRASAVDHGLIIAAFMIYTLSIIYSGGYNPYFGDSPMPAARETLTGALFLGFIYLVVTNQMGFAAIVGILGYMMLPTGGLWMLLTTAAFFVVWRPRDWRRLFMLAALLVVCAMIGTVGPMLIRAFDMPVPGSEFDVRGIVNRLRYVTFWEPSRLAYLIVPAGILPALSMALWRRQDQLARMLTLITMVFFLFFYFQGYRVLLHHFIPAMVPPLIVMWRMKFLELPNLRIASRGAIALALVAAFWLAFPVKPGLHQFSREIGANVELRGDRYVGYQTRALGTFHDLFGRLFPIQYTEEGAAKNYFGGPMVWLHYAVQPKVEGQVITYVVQPLDDPAPTGGRLHDEEDGYGLYVMDEDRFQAHLTTTFSTKFGAPIYQLSRDMIFGRGAQSGERLVIDLVDIARSILGMEKPPASQGASNDG